MIVSSSYRPPRPSKLRSSLVFLALVATLAAAQRRSDTLSVVPYAFRDGSSSFSLLHPKQVYDNVPLPPGKQSNKNNGLMLSKRYGPLLDDSLSDRTIISLDRADSNFPSSASAQNSQPSTLPSRCAWLLQFLAQIRTANANIVRALDNVIGDSEHTNSADFGPMLTGNAGGTPTAVTDSNYSTTTTVMTLPSSTPTQQQTSNLYGQPSSQSNPQQAAPAQSSNNIGSPIIIPTPINTGALLNSPPPNAAPISGTWSPSTPTGNSNSYGTPPNFSQQQPDSTNSTTIGQLGNGGQVGQQAPNNTSVWTPNQQPIPSSQFNGYYSPSTAQQPPRQPSNTFPSSSSLDYGGYPNQQQQQQNQPNTLFTSTLGSNYNPPLPAQPAQPATRPSPPWTPVSAPNSSVPVPPGSNNIGTVTIPPNLTEQQRASFCRLHPQCCALLSQFEQQPSSSDTFAQQQVSGNVNSGSYGLSVASSIAQRPRLAGTSNYWSPPVAVKQSNSTTITYGVLVPSQTTSLNTPPRFSSNKNLDSNLYGVPSYSYDRANSNNRNSNQTLPNGRGGFGALGYDDNTNFVVDSSSLIDSDGNSIIPSQFAEISDEPYRQARSLLPSTSGATALRRPSSVTVANNLERLVAQLAASARALNVIVRNNAQVLSSAESIKNQSVSVSPH